MRKHFKSKKESRSILLIIVIVIVLLILYFFISNLLTKISLGIDDETIIYYALEDTNHYLHHNNSSKETLFLKTIYQVDISNPVTLLYASSHYMAKKEKTVLVYNENYLKEIETVIKPEADKPLVYIYSTHPTESFKNTDLSVHNIEPNIKEVSLILKEKLESIGVRTIVEEGDIPAFLEEHNYNYNQSYTASLHYLKQTIAGNTDIDLIIDLHRDGIAYDYSVTTINDVKYAKIMFVVGLGHNNYQSSLDASNGINEYLKKYYPSISRGIYTNKYSTYNQSYTDNMILIELGGNNNELTEVLNSVDALALSIKEYLYEKRG